MVRQGTRCQGRRVRPFLGVELADLTPALRRYLELPADARGVVIGRILPGSPADRAGFQNGDLVVSVADRPTPTAADLQALVASLQVGQEVRVTLIRGGKRLDATLSLEEMPSRLLQGR